MHRRVVDPYVYTYKCFAIAGKVLILNILNR